MNSPSEKNIEMEIEGFSFLFGRLNEVEPKLHRIIKKSICRSSIYDF